MAREEDKHRAPEYLGPGPVNATRPTMTTADLIRRLKALEEQVASLQLSMPKGIDPIPCRSGCECLRCGGIRKP